MRLSKKEVMKIKPGTIIELSWDDSSLTKAVLLEKPQYKKGDVSLHCFHQYNMSADHHAVHSQVVREVNMVRFY
jgi:hypothetical protein